MKKCKNDKRKKYTSVYIVSILFDSRYRWFDYGKYIC